MGVTHPIFTAPNTPSHFITRYGSEVHRFAEVRLESWVALCGVTEQAESKWPTTCRNCLRSEGR